MKQTKSENTSSKITQRLDSGRKLENYQDLDKLKEVFFLFPGYNWTPGYRTNQGGGKDKAFLSW